MELPIEPIAAYRSTGRYGNPELLLVICLWFAMGLLLGWPADSPAADLSGEEIKAAIVGYVEDNMPWPRGMVRVDFPVRPADVCLPAGPTKIVVQNRPEEIYLGETAFTVKFYSGEKLFREGKVPVVLEVLGDFVVAARALARDREIMAEDVKVLKKWVRRMPANAISAPAEAIGKAAAFNLRPDSEITRNAVKPLLLVKRGSMVRIVLEAGQLSIAAVGVSADDGAADAIIRVRNLSSNKTIYARVASSALVRVDF